MPVKLNQDIPPIAWPQDHLKVPNVGGLPPVNARNAQVTKSEFFVCSRRFTGWDGNSTVSEVLTAPVDADFWITGIVCIGFNNVNQVDVRLNWPIQITDVLTEYQLFNPSIPYPALRLPIDAFASPASTFRSVENLPAPYPLLRKGGLRITMGPNVYTVVTGPWMVYFAFSGWKEYANAAV